MAGLTIGTLRVLEIAHPNVMYCGRLLAEFGAEVVLVEPPAGDVSRHEMPIIHHGPLHGQSASAAYFHVGKHSITLDLRQADGQSLFRQLAQHADVILDGTIPGQLVAWQLDYGTLQSDNPGLIQAAVTPFGQSGPRSEWLATELVNFAMGGLMAVSGSAAGPPTGAPGPHGAIIGGAHAAFAILTALRVKQRTGHGQFIDVSIQACFAAQENLISAYTGEGRSTPRLGSQHRVATPGRVYACQDGWVHFFVSPAQQGAWDRLMEWMGNPPAFAGTEWADARYRRRHAEEIDAAVSKWTGNFTKQVLYKEAQRRKIPCAPVNTLNEYLQDEQVRARGFVAKTVGNPLLEYDYLTSPWMVDGNRRSLAPLPESGEYNEHLYHETLGLSVADLDRLRALAVI